MAGGAGADSRAARRIARGEDRQRIDGRADDDAGVVGAGPGARGADASAPLVLFSTPRCTQAARLSPVASISYIVLLLDRRSSPARCCPRSRRITSATSRRHPLSARRRREQPPRRRSTSRRRRSRRSRRPGPMRPPTVPGAAAGVPASWRPTSAASRRWRVPPRRDRRAQTFTTFTLPVEPWPATGTAPRAREPRDRSSQVIVREARPPSRGRRTGRGDPRPGVVAAVTGTRAVRGAEMAAARQASRRARSRPPSTARAAATCWSASSILGVLAASMVLMVVSMRRSQELARQQMEFVATVSHELRTPLAVVRAAADNLADGVVHDEEQVRKYGELVRSEGPPAHRDGRADSRVRRHPFGTADVDARAGPRRRADRRRAARVGHADRRGAPIDVEVDIPADLPPVAGDEAALRRVFQNLVGNAIKYGAEGGWIGIEARRIRRARCASPSAIAASASRPPIRSASSSRSIAPPTSSRRRSRAPASG